MDENTPEVCCWLATTQESENEEKVIKQKRGLRGQGEFERELTERSCTEVQREGGKIDSKDENQLDDTTQLFMSTTSIPSTLQLYFESRTNRDNSQNRRESDVCRIENSEKLVVFQAFRNSKSN